MVQQDAFVLPAQSVTDQQIRNQTPIVLSENSSISIPLCRSRQKVLPKAAGRVRQEIAKAVEVEGARSVRQIDEGRFDLLHVRAKLQRMRAGDIRENLLRLKTRLASIGRAGC